MWVDAEFFSHIQSPNNVGFIRPGVRLVLNRSIVFAISKTFCIQAYDFGPIRYVPKSIALNTGLTGDT